MKRKYSTRSRAVSGLLFVFCWCFMSTASADRIFFDDGESLPGTLIGVSDGKVQWRSRVLGDVAIEQHHVERIETGERFDLTTSGEHWHNCWMYGENDRQLLHCDEGVQSLSDWTLIVAAGEAVTEPAPRLTQKGNLVLAAEDSSGNNDITKYNIDTRTELRYIESRHTVALRYQEESAESETTRNMWRTSYQYDQFFTDQWFATGNAFYEEDEFKEIDQRTSVGVGMGYQFLETTYFNLLGKGTVNYVDEQLATGERRETPAFLWNLDFSWRFNDKGMEFFHRHAALQAFNRGDDFEINTLTGLKYPINGHFSSVIQLEYDYDNLPAESAVDKKDQKWSIGINYDW